MNTLRIDVLHTWRAIRARPAATIGTMFVLALGVGLVAAMFALADPFLLRPLPYANPADLVIITVEPPRPDPAQPIDAQSSAPPPTLADWRARTDLLTSVAAYRIGESFRLRLPNGAVVLRTARVSDDFFDVLGLRMPRLGVHDPDGRDTAVAISPAALHRLGVQPNVAIGQAFPRHDGGSVRVAGVLPAAFLFPRASIWPRIDAIAPLPSTSLMNTVERDGGRSISIESLTVVARVRPGVSPALVESALSAAQRGASTPRIRARSLSTHMTARVRPLAIGAMVAGLLILVICAANVANLMLARRVYRDAEFATREALGASRADLLRLVAVELVFLTAGGVLAGLLVTHAALVTAGLVIPDEYVALGAPAVTLRVLTFTGLVGIAVMLTGLLPAALAWRPGTGKVLRREVATGGRGLRALRVTITASQTAVAMLLVVGAALLVRSQVNLFSQETGFSGHVIVVSASYPAEESGARLRASVEAIIEDARRVPGVTHAAAAVGPMVDGSRVVGAGFGAPASPKIVTPGYFEAVGCTLVAGRLFVDGDTRVSTVVVNEAFARLRWPDRPAVGQRPLAQRPAEVIGVVRDTFDVGLDSRPEPTVYLLMDDGVAGFGSENRVDYIVRTSERSTAAALLVQRAITRASPDATMIETSTIEERLGQSVRNRSFATLVSTFFAVAGTGICLAGLVALVAFVVGRRTREIAIRVALGASPARVAWLVTSEAMAGALVGIAVGSIAGIWAARTLESLLYGIRADDWSTPVAAAVAMLAVTAVASLVPAIRAIRLAPSTALRLE
jgi:putative ABC transport system permease protein